MKQSLQRMLGACISAGVLGMAVASPAVLAADQTSPGSPPAVGNASVSTPAHPDKSLQQTASNTPESSRIDEGKKIAFDRSKGNCLACHALPGGDMPGNIGPAFPYKGTSMKQRFPKREALRAQIFNPMQNNPHTVMPPFGLNRILTEDELDKVVDYIWSL